LSEGLSGDRQARFARRLLMKQRVNRAATWEQQARMDYEHAKRVLLTEGAVMGLFVIHGAEASHVVGVPGFDDQVREHLPKLLMLMCIQHDAQAISHIAEAWMRVLPRQHGETEAEHFARANATRAAEAEDRIEVVITTTTWRDEAGEAHTIGHCGEIVRNPRGKPQSVRERDEAGTEYGGRWIDLLPSRRPTAAERAMASEVLQVAMRESGLGIVAADLHRRH
jgi:hypothetical protein